MHVHLPRDAHLTDEHVERAEARDQTCRRHPSTNASRAQPRCRPHHRLHVLHHDIEVRRRTLAAKKSSGRPPDHHELHSVTRQVQRQLDGPPRQVHIGQPTYGSPRSGRVKVRARRAYRRGTLDDAAPAAQPGGAHQIRMVAGRRSAAVAATGV